MEEAFDAKRLWRKAAEEVVDEALGFDPKRAWRKALASRGAKSYDGLVVATVTYEDGGLSDDGTQIWKALTQYKLPDRAPELQPEDELGLVAAASAPSATAADLSRLKRQVGGTAVAQLLLHRVESAWSAAGSSRLRPLHSTARPVAAP